MECLLCFGESRIFGEHRCWRIDSSKSELMRRQKSLIIRQAARRCGTGASATGSNKHAEQPIQAGCNERFWPPAPLRSGMGIFKEYVDDIMSPDTVLKNGRWIPREWARKLAKIRVGRVDWANFDFFLATWKAIGDLGTKK